MLPPRFLADGPTTLEHGSARSSANLLLVIGESTEGLAYPLFLSLAANIRQDGRDFRVVALVLHGAIGPSCGQGQACRVYRRLLKWREKRARNRSLAHRPIGGGHAPSARYVA